MNPLLKINQDLFFLIFNLGRQNKLLEDLMIFGAEYLIYLLAAAVVLLFFIGTAKEKGGVYLIVISSVIGFLLLFTIGTLIKEPRPFVAFHLTPLIKHEISNSFPSRHTLIATILVLPFLFYRSRFAWVGVITLVWIGFARIFVGVHFPLDILGGFIYGLVSVSAAVYVKKFLAKRFSLDI